MNHTLFNLIKQNIEFIYNEIRLQKSVEEFFPKNDLSFNQTMSHINSFNEASEFGLAYSYLLGALENYPFILTSEAAVKLLEIGLLLGYKGDSVEEKIFDRRII